MANSPFLYGPTGSLFIGTPQGGAGTVLTNDGVGNLSWTSPSSNAPIVFNFANDQVALANVTGFAVTSTTAFVAEMSILRTSSAYTLVLNEIDTTFDTNVGSDLDAPTLAVGIGTDNTVVIGGDKTAQPSGGILKLNSDGTLDTAFNTNLGTGTGAGNVYAVAVQANNQTVIGGMFTTFNGNSRGKFTRLNSDGTEDSTFVANSGGSGSQFGQPVFALAMQANQQILVGGEMSDFHGSSIASNYARINSDGSLDSAFNTNLGTGFNNPVYATAQQSNLQILVGGDFNTFNGNTRGRLVRLNSDGTEDTTFSTNLGTGFAALVDTISVQSNQQIIVGGQFTTFNGNTRNYLVRLNSDGTEDTTFYTNLGTSFNNFVNATAIQSNQQIVVGGSFTTFNGNTRDYSVRLNSDGTEDTAYYTGFSSNFNGAVNAIAVQPNQQIVMGGSFTASGSISGYAMRYGVLDPVPAMNVVSVQEIKGIYNALTTTWTIQGFDALANGNTGVDFSMSTSGQLQYTSSNLTDSTSNVMTFTIQEL